MAAGAVRVMQALHLPGVLEAAGQLMAGVQLRIELALQALLVRVIPEVVVLDTPEAQLVVVARDRLALMVGALTACQMVLAVTAVTESPLQLLAPRHIMEAAGAALRILDQVLYLGLVVLAAVAMVAMVGLDQQVQRTPEAGAVVVAKAVVTARLAVQAWSS